MKVLIFALYKSGQVRLEHTIGESASIEELEKLKEYVQELISNKYALKP